MVNSKQKRSTTRRRTKSSIGRIRSPIDVRTDQDLGGMMERIQSGPLTLVFVYADWCGHCKTFSPHFENAISSKNRSVQVVKVNDGMLNKVNSHVSNKTGNGPLKVSGFPSLILVGKNGNAVSEVDPVPNTGAIRALVEKSGNIAAKAENIPAVSQVQKLNNMNITNEEDPVYVSPPESSSEEIAIHGESMPYPELGSAINQNGGVSLVDALTSASTTLAPAGVLLALASATNGYVQRNRRIKHRKNRKTHKRIHHRTRHNRGRRTRHN